MTLTAVNRVGILAAVSNAIAELGGDVQEVSVTVMQKYFTIILAADFPDHRESQVIVDHVTDIGRPYGLEVCLKDPDAELFQNGSDEGTEAYYLRISGRNQPGTMRLVAARLAQDGVDIADLYAVRNGSDEFEMVLEITVPIGFATNGLLDAINDIGERGEVNALLESRDDFLGSRTPHSLRMKARHVDCDPV
jgi:glycine cleavage system transcriptional repressor